MHGKPRRKPRHFNPRSREGSDFHRWQSSHTTSGISIHAPAKGATEGRKLINPVTGISIHAPAKGATRSMELGLFEVKISIHAPAKGATPSDKLVEFRSRFQSTLPRRERPDIADALDFARDFNPRSREGSDALFSPTFSPISISIHAPAKGATFLPSSRAALSVISIHAPAKGATIHLYAALRFFSNFNPRSREGSDFPSVLSSKADYNFNPRSREGSDIISSIRRKLLDNFNPRSREGSDSKNHQDYPR